jgi:hypothetical protein
MKSGAARGDGYQRHAKMGILDGRASPCLSICCTERHQGDVVSPRAACTPSVQSAAAGSKTSNEMQGSRMAAVFSPIPFTRRRSPIVRKGPALARTSRIRPARLGPTRGRRMRSSSPASLIRIRPSSARPGGAPPESAAEGSLCPARTTRSESPPPGGGSGSRTATRTRSPRARRPPRAISARLSSGVKIKAESPVGRLGRSVQEGPADSGPHVASWERVEESALVGH